jgi:hypothetical protein
METRQAFKIALGTELICWLAVGDLRVVIIYGLLVFAACRGLYLARE